MTSLTNLQNVSYQQVFAQLAESTKNTQDSDPRILKLIQENMEKLGACADKSNVDISFEMGGKIVISQGSKPLNKEKIKNLEIFTRFAKDYLKTHPLKETEAKEVEQALDSAVKGVGKLKSEQAHFSLFNEIRLIKVLEEVKKGDEYLLMNEEVKKKDNPSDVKYNALIDKITEYQKIAKQQDLKMKKADRMAKIFGTIGIVGTVGWISAVIAGIFFPAVGIPLIILCGIVAGVGLLGAKLSRESTFESAERQYKQCHLKLKALEQYKSHFDHPEFSSFVGKFRKQDLIATKPEECHRLFAIYQELKKINAKIAETTTKLQSASSPSIAETDYDKLHEQKDKLIKEVNALQKSLNHIVLTDQEMNEKALAIA